MTLVEVDLDELRADVCDKLCKYADSSNKRIKDITRWYLAERRDDDFIQNKIQILQDELVEDHCNNCPLKVN